MRARRALIIAFALAFAFVFAPVVPAAADAADGTTASMLHRADQDVRAGRCTEAAAAAEAVARRPGVMARADRAEAWRVLGLAQLCAGHVEGAEASFLELLRLDPDARLDPDLVPPDTIAFFERVRLDHRDIIEAHRLPPPRSRVLVFNLLPPLGQFQNGHRVKGWLVAGVGVSLLAANVATFAILDGWCNDEGICETEAGTSRNDEARRLRTVNTLTGVALVGTLLYGVADGFYYHHKYSRADREARERRQYALGVEPLPNSGVMVSVGGSF